MKRKKITALLAAFAMTVGLAAGCGNTEKAETSTDNAVAEEPAAENTDFGYISADKSIAENQFDADSPYQPFVEELNYALPRGPLAEWPSVSDAISLAFNQVMAN